jgi:hypothetical protein
MKKLLIISLFTLLLSSTSKADYNPLELYRMILTAEEILYGEIISQDSTTFTLKVDSSLTGQENEITIEKFEDWACAHRWTNYQVGQKLFLFLTRFKGKLVVMSGGNEGEIPIFQDSIYISSLSIVPPPPPPPSGKTLSKEVEFFESNKYNIYGRDYFGFKISLPEFIKTVKNIRNCFSIEMGTYNRIVNASTSCSKDVMDKFITEDKIFRWTYKKLMK